MSADLHIHIAQNITEDDLKCFFSSTLGSKYCDIEKQEYQCPEKKYQQEVYKKYQDIPYTKYLELKNKIIIDYPEAHKFWLELLDQYYREVRYQCSHWEHIVNSPNIWVGEMSWLRAALFEDSDSFVPGPIEKICEIIGEDLPVIDDKFIEQIKVALGLPNNTVKEDGVWNGSGYKLAEEEKVIEFLEQFKGQKCFTVRW